MASEETVGAYQSGAQVQAGQAVWRDGVFPFAASFCVQPRSTSVVASTLGARGSLRWKARMNAGEPAGLCRFARTDMPLLDGEPQPRARGCCAPGVHDSSRPKTCTQPKQHLRAATGPRQTWHPVTSPAPPKKVRSTKMTRRPDKNTHCTKNTKKEQRPPRQVLSQ